MRRRARRTRYAGRVTETSPGITATESDELGGDARSVPVLTVVLHPSPALLGRRMAFAPGAHAVLGRGSRALGAGALDDDRLSREHARVERVGDALRLVDLGSRNGTELDGARVQSAELRDGAVVRIGRVMLLAHRGPLELDPPRHATLIGVGHAMRELLDQIELVAERDLTVLVQGETGVGKELVAEELHRRGRREGPFVAINCGGLGEGVLQSELFGHERGAFSGAEQRRPGLIAHAGRGTLLLDEIGDAPPSLQVALLRLLEQREYRPVGSDRALRAEARFVAATHVPLEPAVRAGRFREDLFARIARWTVHVPPLRDRREDVVPLALHFARALGAEDKPIARRLALALLRHDWPRNVRELAAVIERAAVESAELDELTLGPPALRALAATGEDREPADAPAAMPARGPRPRPSPDALRERLRAHAGNVRALSQELGVARNTLYRWFSEAGIDPDALRERG